MVFPFFICLLFGSDYSGRSVKADHWDWSAQTGHTQSWKGCSPQHLYWSSPTLVASFLIKWIPLTSGWVLTQSASQGGWLHLSTFYSCRFYPTEQTYDGPGGMVTSLGGGRSWLTSRRQSRWRVMVPVHVHLHLLFWEHPSSQNKKDDAHLCQFAPADLPSGNDSASWSSGGHDPSLTWAGEDSERGWRIVFSATQG